MEYMLRTEAELKRLAAGQGLFLKLPKKNELFIDLDSVEAQDLFWKRYDTFVDMFPIRDLIIRPSKSGPPHLHVTVVLHRDVTDMERVALQAVLGSDPKREMLAVKNNGVAENATVFFEVRRDEEEGDKEASTEDEGRIPF